MITMNVQSRTDVVVHVYYKLTSVSIQVYSMYICMYVYARMLYVCKRT